MIYIIYGSDQKKASAAFSKLIDRLVERKPDASLVRVQNETFSNEELDELVGGQGLFEQKCIVAARGLLSNKDLRDVLVKRMKEIAASENIFIFLEEVLDAKSKKAFEKHAEKIQHTEAKEIRTKDRYNIFSLGEVLGQRDRTHLWTKIQEARLAGITSEEVHRILLWQTKSMLLACCTKDALEAEMKPFPYNKAKSLAKNFSENELRKLSWELVALFHIVRRGELDFDIALERFVLST